MQKICRLYLVLAAMMLLCLAPMPYGYFQLVRLLATLAFGVMLCVTTRSEWRGLHTRLQL